MYEAFYGFKEKPFSLLPDPDFLYLSENHRSAFNVLEYSFTGQAGFAVISGEVGSGKTTLLRSFLEHVDSNSTVGLITNTPRSHGNLLQWILLAFGIESQGKEKIELYQVFCKFVTDQYAAGRRSVLIVDEAQNLDAEALEELRMLSNLNSGKDLLLQVILVGQPELIDTLSQPNLRQFAQRIAVSYQLRPLNSDETHAYICHRLTRAGGDASIFTQAACDAVYHLSGGIPRLINGLCDLALVYGFGEGRRRIDLDTVLSVFEDREQGGLGQAQVSMSKEALSQEILRLQTERKERSSKRMGSDDDRFGSDAGETEPPSEQPEFLRVVPQEQPSVPPRSSTDNTSPGEPRDEPADDQVDVADLDLENGPEERSEIEDHPPISASAHASARDRELIPDFADRPVGATEKEDPRPTRLRWGVGVVFVACLLTGIWFVATPTAPHLAGAKLDPSVSSQASKSSLAPVPEKQASQAAQAVTLRKIEERAVKASQAADLHKIEEQAHRAAQAKALRHKEGDVQKPARADVKPKTQEPATYTAVLEQKHQPAIRASDHFEAGVAAYRREDFDEAIVRLSASIGSSELPNAELAKAYRRRGDSFVGKKQYDMAIADYTEMIRLRPGDPVAYNSRAYAYNSLGQSAKALADTNRAIEINSAYAYAYSNRCWAYQNIRQREKAIADCRRALELNPQLRFPRRSLQRMGVEL